MRYLLQIVQKGLEKRENISIITTYQSPYSGLSLLLSLSALSPHQSGVPLALSLLCQQEVHLCLVTF